MQAAADTAILARAAREDRMVVSADTDFAELLALANASKPSSILFRDPNLITGDDFVRILLSVLQDLESALNGGCVVVFKKGLFRIRQLPFRPL